MSHGCAFESEQQLHPMHCCHHERDVGSRHPAGWCLSSGWAARAIDEEPGMVTGNLPVQRLAEYLSRSPRW